MKYQDAKDIYEELRNFEGKATFKAEETIIDLFVLISKDELKEIEIEKFLDIHTVSGSFEIEGSHDSEYTIIAISRLAPKFTNDMEYFRKLLVW